RPLETGDRRDAALADERSSGDRRSGCCRRPEPHAGAGTPELRPYHMKPRMPGITRPPADPCNKVLVSGTLLGDEQHGQHHHADMMVPCSPAERLIVGESALAPGIFEDPLDPVVAIAAVPSISMRRSISELAM